MIDICCDELEKTDSRLNVNKSQIVGKLCARKTNTVIINGSPL